MEQKKKTPVTRKKTGKNPANVKSGLKAGETRRAKYESKRIAANTFMSDMAKRAVGRPRIFNSPEEFSQALLDYIDYIENNQLEELKVFGTGVKINVKKAVPATIGGFCAFCGMTYETFYDYGRQPDYSEIVSRVHGLLKYINSCLAASGLCDSNVIMRICGIAENVNVEQTTSMNAVINIVPIETGVPFSSDESEIKD